MLSNSGASLESRLRVTARRLGELGARSDKEIAQPPPIDVRPRELSAVAADSSDT